MFSFDLPLESELQKTIFRKEVLKISDPKELQDLAISINDLLTHKDWLLKQSVQELAKYKF